MEDMKLHRLFNYIEQGQEDKIREYAQQNPKLLAKNSSSYGYKTPLCKLIEKNYELVHELAKLNTSSLSEDCTGRGGVIYSENVLFMLISKHEVDFAYKLAQLNHEAVNFRVLSYLLKHRDQEYIEDVIKFAKLNPKVLFQEHFNGTIISDAVQIGNIPQIVEQLIDIAEEYQQLQKSEDGSNHYPTDL